MRKTLCLFVVLSLQSPLLADDKETEKFVGTWKVDEFVVNGKSIPGEARVKIRIEFTKDTMSMKSEGNDEAREMKFALDAKTSPKTIKTTPTKGPYKDESVTGIYKFEEEMLVLCISNKPTDETPKEFESAEGSKLALLKLSRAK